MSEFSEAMDVLMADADGIIERVSDVNGTFTYEDFLYALISENQKAYIEYLYLCRDHKHPFNSAHVRIGTRLSKILGDEYTNADRDGTTVDIFHSRTKNYIYRRK